MLPMPDRVAEIESHLTDEEKSLLASADQKLIAKVPRAYPTEACNHGEIAQRKI